jgi:hypothetical protein
MGIPNLANRRSRGQERQSRCILAMPNLAIHLGYHRLAGTRQPAASAHSGVDRRRPQANRMGRIVS